MDEVITFGIVAVLLLLNGLFVAAEFAIVAVPRAAIDRRAAQGHRIAMRIMRILKEPRHQDTYIATAQLGVTLASLGLGMYGEHKVADMINSLLVSWDGPSWLVAHGTASIISVAFLSYLHIVLGEVIPKALALQEAERSALAITPFMNVVSRIVYPLVMLLNACGNAVLRSFGIRRTESASERYYTAEDLQYIVRESQEGGLIHHDSGRLLKKLFRFGDLTAGEVLVPRVRMTGVQAGCPQSELIKIVKNSSFTRYPVYEGSLDTIVGFLHIKDVLRRLLEGRSIQKSDVRAVPFVPETAPLDNVLEIMRRKRVQVVVVMDEHGGTAGMVTIEDLFEEVVGGDEQRASEEFRTDPSGRLRVAGTVRLDMLADRLQVPLDHDEVDTVSGLVLSILGRPPRITDVVDYMNVRFEVSGTVKLGVKECIVTVLTPQTTDDGGEWNNATDRD